MSTEREKAAIAVAEAACNMHDLFDNELRESVSLIAFETDTVELFRQAVRSYEPYRGGRSDANIIPVAYLSNKECNQRGTPSMTDAAAPDDKRPMTDDLAALARENERLRQNVEAAQASFLRSCTRIRELEAELAKEKELSSTFNMLAVNHCLDKHKVEAERDALSRLTIPPLPEESAALIIELEARAHERAGKNSMVEIEQLLEWQAAAALRPLAQENEGLHDRLDFIDSFGGIDATKERIRELEAELAEFTRLKEYAKSLGQQTFIEIHAENERLKGESEHWQFQYETADLSAKRLGGKWKANEERIRELEAERDAWCRQSELQCRTRESEVVAIRVKTIEECAQVVEQINSGPIARARAAAIRALAQTDESKTESGK